MAETRVHRLVEFLSDGHRDDPLSAELGAWLGGSRRFRSFVEAHRDKVRKKLRTARETDARLDVRAELAVAHALVADRRIELAFEASGARRGGPDFTVTFRGHRAFNLEVTRWRGSRDAARHGRPLLAKLRQLPPGIANAVLVAVEGDVLELDPPAIVREWQLRAAAGDDALFDRHGLNGVRGFRSHLARLGGVILWRQAVADRSGSARLWRLPSARSTLPDQAARAVLDALDPGSGS